MFCWLNPIRNPTVKPLYMYDDQGGRPGTVTGSVTEWVCGTLAMGRRDSVWGQLPTVRDRRCIDSGPG